MEPPQNRTYYGIQGTGDDEGEWQPARLMVEEAADGPTERQNMKVLRALKAKDEAELEGFGRG